MAEIVHRLQQCMKLTAGNHKVLELEDHVKYMRKMFVLY